MMIFFFLPFPSNGYNVMRLCKTGGARTCRLFSRCSFTKKPQWGRDTLWELLIWRKWLLSQHISLRAPLPETRDYWAQTLPHSAISLQVFFSPEETTPFIFQYVFRARVCVCGGGDFCGFKKKKKMVVVVFGKLLMTCFLMIVFGCRNQYFNSSCSFN